MKEKEIAIIGGGLAGLTAALHLTSAGFKIRVYEKESYPRHKVCGEYLSREILPYLDSLGVPLDVLKPVSIGQLVYSTTGGKMIKTDLPLGGIGISRFALDHYLYKNAMERGVEIIADTVTDVKFQENQFLITTATGTETTSTLVLGAFGKRSSLDKKLERSFITKKNGWLAVKGHYKMDSFPEHTVALHNFKGGYCGLSKTETSVVNVCYLATYKSFKEYKNPETYKEKVLSGNKHLHSFFEKATPLFSQDLSIAQISFDTKTRIQDHILMMGDAAGLIHPLCGNGMAMAIHSAKIASEAIIKYYKEDGLDRSNLEEDYERRWDINFRSRLQTGRILQKVLLNPSLAAISQLSVNLFPSLLSGIIKKTHGNTIL